ncbi:hypothetical protein CI109_107155 [Kwoniella shandongensis]|uniref:Uncharacterized protein n=1 Tax=Kwoniella shandongensis TaxID=1734106 RepID=A0A5M6C1U8_9TREE|nr:uncharacterized protein CI109_002438 [Kwoniella shandongensis]KAA5529097.1 hypothetical protein CI109_002438 [Kwoniella shandongensis]
MSDDLHPDLEYFYDSLEPGEHDDDWEDDPDDGEFYIDAEDIVIDEDDGDYLDEDYDDDDDEGESDEDMAGVTFLSNPNGRSTRGGQQEAEAEDDDDEGGDDDGSGQAFIELAQLINSSSGSVDARTALLARLLSGGAPVTRSAGASGLLRSLAGRGMSDEDRARQQADRRRKERWWTPQTEPDPKGQELLRSGEFGRVGDWRAPGKAGRMRPRIRDPRCRGWNGAAARPSPVTIPNTAGTVVASYPSIPYVGQFAREDYSIFYTATQFYTIHLYDTTKSRNSIPKRRRRATSQPAPSLSPAPTPSVEEEDEEENEDDYEDEEDEEDWGDFSHSGGRRITAEETSLKKIKTVQGIEGSWTVTDCDADKKGEKMIYSSITPSVHMLYTSQFDQEHVELNFAGQRRFESMWGYDRFGIWSIRFSADGKEVVAGAGSGKIMVYDIEAQQRSLSVSGHADDVNAVCFADESSTNILVSGSDDGYVKVWDRRSLSSSTPSGILVGATEGITYTSPKGDGRYIVVNSKDQAARLYDLRKMRSHSEFESEPDAVARYGQSSFDYRHMRYPPPKRLAHPKDCSVMTYRGHSVLRTLIRCHFSPRESTGQSYIYSGSADGLIHIWSLDGQVVQVLNRAESAPIRAANGDYSDPSAPSVSSQNPRYSVQPYESYGMGFTVRDVAWHGYEPTLMSTCWEVDGGYRRGGTVAKHEWKGLGKGGMGKLEDWVEKKKQESRSQGDVVVGL